MYQVNTFQDNQIHLYDRLHVQKVTGPEEFKDDLVFESPEDESNAEDGDNGLPDDEGIADDDEDEDYAAYDFVRMDVAEEMEADMNNMVTSDDEARLVIASVTDNYRYIV